MKTLLILFVVAISKIVLGQPLVGTIEPPPSLDCRGLSGFVRNPKHACSNHFYLCTTDSEGRSAPAERQFCDNQRLVFDQITETCVDNDLLPECVPPFEVDCGVVGPGLYSNPKYECSSYFYQCRTDAKFQIRSCPEFPARKFDVASGTCQFPEYVDSCGGASTTPESAPSSTSEPPLIDCSLHGPGNVENPAEPCSNSYFTCLSDNITVVARWCPTKPELKYDKLTDKCLKDEYILSCNGNPTPAETTVTATPGPGIDCSQFDVGNVQNPVEPCSNIYYACLERGDSVKFNCAVPQIRYDVISDSCLYPEFVVACGGRATTTEEPVPYIHGQV